MTTSTIVAPNSAAATNMYIARALRDFGDGFVALLLPVYLGALGLGAIEIGVVATLALLGSALTTLAIGAYGGRFDQRLLLIAASALMIATGLAFAAANSYLIVACVAFVGTANPSSGNVSIFVPLEHSVLARSVLAAERTKMFARYGLMGAFAAAAGSLAAASPEFLAAAGITAPTALKLMFVLYAVLGLAGACVYARLPPEPPLAEARTAALGPSRAVVYKLAALFSIDAFAGGFAVQSLIAFWLFSKFSVSLVTASWFFFGASLLAAFSQPVAAWLSRHIGLVNTMVYTHIPSSVFLIIAALVPNMYVAFALLLLRAALSQMDVPARASYVMAVVTPPERTAAASFTSVPRSLASAISPVIAGALFEAGLPAWPLIICGVLKIVYDIALLWTFRHVKPPEEQ